MEPIYNDPNYWMRWHAELQELQSARQEADQAGFEQQLGELQLRSPEESSGGSSPDTPAARSHENIQRTDVGGSMRMPPRSNLRSNAFSSARHSVDVPHAHLGSAANNYRSDLREGPFSCMRYAAPSEEQPTARTKDNRPRGLFSRVKSVLSKVFGGSHREKWSGGPAFDVVVSFRMDFAKRSRPSEADLELIEEFKTALGANRAAKTIENYVRALRMFSEFLQPKGVTLNDLLGNAELLTAYKDEFNKVASANSRNLVGPALNVLQNFQAGNPISAPARSQPMHPEDKRMINQFGEAVKSYRVAPDGTRGRGTGTVPLATIKNNMTALNGLARWLRAQNKDPLAPRAFNEPMSLAADIDEYVEAGGDHDDRLSAALSHLRRMGADGLQAVGPGPRLMGRQTLAAHPEDVSIIDDFLTDALSKLGSDATRKEKDDASMEASRLRCFSDWLQREGRPSIMDRIEGNAEQQRSLSADYSAYRKATNRSAPLNLFRQYLGLETRQRPRAYDDDASLIASLANEELRNLLSDPASKQRRKVIQNTASSQRKFSDWLRTEGRESIASRINGNSEQQRSLEADLRAFREATGRHDGVGLKKLKQYLLLVEANRALGVTFRQHGQAGLQEPARSSSTWSPRVPSDFDPSEWPAPQGPVAPAGWQDPAGSSFTRSPRVPSDFERPTPEGAPARPSDIYHGLPSFTDLPSTPQEMGEDAQSRPVLSPAGRPPFFIGSSGTPQELEEIGYLVGEDWQHGTQPAPDFLLDVLDNMLLPSSQMAPQPVSINGETYSIALGPRGRRDAQLIHHPGPSSVPDARIGASRAPAPQGPVAAAGWQDPAGSSFTRSPRVPSDFERPTPEGAPARSSDIYHDLPSFTDLPSTPQEMREDAQSRPVLSPAGRPPFFIGSSGTPQELEEIGYLVGEDWQHGTQPAPDFLLDVLDNMLLPSSQMAPQPVSINGETYSIALGPRGRRDAQLIHHPGPSSVPDARIGASRAPAPQGPVAAAGWQDPAGSSFTRSPRVPSDFERPTPEGAPARSSDIYHDLPSFTDLPSTPQEMREDAQSRPVLSPAGRPPFFIGSSGTPQELEEIGYLVGEDWQHGTQPVPDFLLDVLDNMLLPSSQMAPQPVSINGETYSIALGPRGRRDAQLIHHPGPSSVPDARIGASRASASASDRSGRVLGAGEWLGDQHIQRDYELLSQELRQSNPNLAARTRFVDPLIAFQVGHGTHGDALDAFHRIVNDRNGNDTADFLFLPVSDASATDLRDRGSHWSLLLVDRRDRDRPVAYHYNSAKPHNATPAAKLAARVGADLRDAPMREQGNHDDCGVFVVDGTRELVRRLAGRRQADLNLLNLVVDRQALQNRLRG